MTWRKDKTSNQAKFRQKQKGRKKMEIRWKSKKDVEMKKFTKKRYID